jgi:hypothetical protein
MKSELLQFILFLLYGGSNLYIISYLRKKGDHTVGMIDFLSIFAGNIKNYKKLNDMFVQSFMERKNNVVFNKCISIIHLASPLLIPVAIVYFVFSIGFY